MSEIKTQAFPGAYPGGVFLPATGASETNTLGYTFNTGPTDFHDSVYHLSFTFNHSASSINVNFTSDLEQSQVDESWGLDNVVVAVPEPNSFALCLLTSVPLLIGLRSTRGKF